jgi:RNA polymerase primary sigma factor
MILDNPFAAEDAAWERALAQLNNGDTLSAAGFLALMEPETEESLQEALVLLGEKGISLDLSDLPDLSGKGEAAVRLRREKALAQAGTLLRDLEESDPLRLYLEELARTPASGNEAVLAQKAAEGDKTAQTQLMQLSLSRVVELAQELAGQGVLLLDLIQEGGLGLWECILSWQGQGDFGAYRDFMIRQSFVKALLLQARAAGVGQRLRQSMEDYRNADEALLLELGRNPTVEEIGEKLHISAQEALTLSDMVEIVTNYSRSLPQEETAEEEENMAVEDTAYFQTRQRIEELLSGLSEQEAKLLSLRFGLEGGAPLDPAKTGKQLGLTPEEVVAMETAALEKLRK